MKSFDTVGLIINPVAGQGEAINLNLARQGIVTLGVRKVFTGIGSLGANALENLSCELVTFPVDKKPSRNQTLQLANRLASQAVDLVLVVGGDGTLADVAYVFAQHEDPPPLLGIGVGSTNAGVLVACTAGEINRLRTETLESVPLTGLLAYLEDELVGVGFNDCVLGLTVVATIEGRLRDVGVADKFAGRNVPAKPKSIGWPQTRVERVGLSSHQVIATGETVGTVIIGLAEPAFIAKAIAGGVCLASFTGLYAGCLVADQPLVRIDITADEVLDLDPIHSTFLSFREEDRIRVKGVREGTGLCVDGTPLRLLTPDEEVSFGVRPRAVQAMKFAN